jgi:hypothetical protein
MTPCSRAQMSRAETSPPSCPSSNTFGSVARARTMSLATPATSSGTRSRPKRRVSASISQAPNLGQARVQLVQPRWPWPQSPGPSSSSRWKGR